MALPFYTDVEMHGDIIVNKSIIVPLSEQIYNSDRFFNSNDCSIRRTISLDESYSILDENYFFLLQGKAEIFMSPDGYS